MPGTQTAKRKKTADMMDSPPKRVTRARVKNTDVDDAVPKPKATRITTASAKIAATKKKPAEPIKPAKRKTRADDENGEFTEQVVPEQEAKPEHTKIKARMQKEVTSQKDEDQRPEAPKTKARPTRATAAEVTKPDGPKTRGRPKKAPEAAPAPQEAQKEVAQPMLPKKTTRGRPVTNPSETQSTTSTVKPVAVAPKKRVKFQQEVDKENVPMETGGLKKSALKPTGLKAKPVRKPAATRATTRGKKAAIPKAQEGQELGKKELLPLSPKKINQVAKSDPVVSEDELAGEKPPIKALSKSPARAAISPVKDLGSVSKLNFAQVTAPSSPSKITSSSILASPARRPPPSPFKDGLKVSPKKVQLGDSPAQPRLLPSRTPMKASLLQESPRRANLGDNMTQPILLPSRSPYKLSLLQESPKRAKIEDKVTRPTQSPPRSPSKASLLQSRARRPTASPVKSTGFVSPIKSGMEAPAFRSAITSRQGSPSKTSSFSPEKAICSPFSARALEQTIKVLHTDEEPEINEEEEEASPALPTETPITKVAAEVKSPLRIPVAIIEKPVSFDNDSNTESVAEVQSPMWAPVATFEEPVSFDNDSITEVVAESKSPLQLPVATSEEPVSFDDDSNTQVVAEVNSPLRIPVATFEEPVSLDDTIVMDQSEPVTDSEHIVGSSKPSETPTLFKGPAFSLASAALRRVSIESGSEDELASPEKGYGVTPLRKHGVSARDFGTPGVIDGQISDASEDQLSFTPLANQLSSWTASSPSKEYTKPRSRQARGLFSLAGPGSVENPEQSIFDFSTGSPAKSSFFEDEMAMRDDQENVEGPSFTEINVINEQDLAALQVSQDSQASEEYGDENAVPSDAEILRAEQDHTLTCTPAKAFTPAKKSSQQPREIHTVSKVPLRASADDSPLVVTRQRSRSFGGPLSVVHEAHQDSARRSEMLEDTENKNMSLDQPTTPVLVATTLPQTPASAMKLDAETPRQSVRKPGVPNVLQGAVVFVDVHTAEGADASGIFVDLLTQMGARCVKQWSWNPRTSIGCSLTSNAPQAASPDTARVGITHVVYKDGGKRTLEKIQSSNGAVLCVGVGWVLDCERESKWLDEADYAIDTSIVPRGGSRRRKSMEPRALANMNGNLISATTETPVKVLPSNEMSPTKEFLTFDTPASRRDTFVIERQTPQVQEPVVEPATPIQATAHDDMLEDGSAWGSPTTPYYLSKGAALVQRTCPPKQMGFPVSGDIDDQPDETVRRRLLEARRKSMQWASRVRSPLGRTVSYGK